MEAFIDPYLFSCPNHLEGKDRFIQFIEGISFCKNLEKLNCVNSYYHEDLIHILFETESYPAIGKIKECISIFGIDFLQAQDVESLLNSLLKSCRYIRSSIHLNDEILYIIDSFIPAVNRPVQFKILLEELAVIMAIKCRILSIEQRHLVIVWNESKGVSISGKIELAEFSNNQDDIENVDFEHQFEAVQCHLDQLCMVINPPMIWQIGRNFEDFDFAIRSYCFRHGMIQNSAMDNFPSYFFGLDFLDDCNQLIDTSTKVTSLLQAIAESLLNLNLTSTHALRVGRGGGDPQIEETGFKAWRRDINHDLHLHYWKKGTQIEFANVGHHDDFKISSVSSE